MANDAVANPGNGGSPSNNAYFAPDAHPNEAGQSIYADYLNAGYKYLLS